MSAVSGGGWTPGPWVFERTYSPDGSLAKVTTVAHCGEYVIGLASGIPGGNYRDGDPSGTTKADARLIASAPDLFNALSVLADAAESLGIPVDAARASLARATGAATTDGERG